MSLDKKWSQFLQEHDSQEKSMQYLLWHFTLNQKYESYDGVIQE